MIVQAAQLAVSVALRHRDNGSFLLVLRARAPSKGQWAFAGGKVHFGETLAEAAARELMEETGLVADTLEPCAQFEIIQKTPQTDSPAHHFYLVVHSGIGSGEPVAADDAEEARWVSLEEAKSMPLTASTRQIMEQISCDAG